MKKDWLSKYTGEDIMSFRDLSKKISWKLFNMLYENKYDVDTHTVRYLYKNNKSDMLCIVVSAFPQKNQMPSYNLVKTLWGKFNEGNLLYICDDMVNIPTGGSYYIGCGGDYWGMDAIESLISSVIIKSGAKKVIGIGSSKAGTAALMFGLKMKFDYLIVGACQYKIGSYLNCNYHTKTLKELTGMSEVTHEAILRLDSYLPQIISNNKGTATKIYFHYSDSEHTYKEQIEELLLDLYKNDYEIVEDLHHYEHHDEVSRIFPAFLIKSLNQILQDNLS